MVELVILMEELGYALAPVPFLSNAAAGLALQTAGSDEQQERWLPGIANGEVRATVGVASRRGAAALVPDAEGADVIVLLDRRPAAACVEAVRRRDRAAGDDRRDAPLRARRRATGRASRCRRRARRARPDRRPLCPPSSSGVRQRAMEMAVEYARDRKQFGRPIGAYQARGAPLRADAAGDRGRPLGLLLRGLDRRRRARDAARWRRRWPRPTRRTRAGASPRRRSRCTAASASPGSTTSTSSSSGRRPTGCSRLRARAPRARGRAQRPGRRAGVRLAGLGSGEGRSAR